ncbi:cation efflux protein [Lichtheimia hyalospora FSU 10163]|nr:cation efflux protein [Lichtheimia hyalospora FSU 10163]
MKNRGTSKKVQKFYREQNDLIDNMLSPLNPIDEEDEQRQMLKVKIAVYGSGMANVVLFALQLVAAVSSGSLSIFATMADSFMDLLSSVVLMWAARQVSRPNPIKYPAGKERMETAAIMVFSCLMSCVAIFLIIESAQRLAEGNVESPDLSTLSIALVATALGVKFLLYIYCSTLSQYSSAKVFAQDHRNDILVNGLGLISGILGSRLAGWVDPTGSIIIALIILRSWTATLIDHTKLIVGKTADNEFLKRATYIALTHPGVHQVDTCRAYYAGNNLFVEVDIVLPPDTMLRESHDIGESLQIKLESIPTVARAFVHVDYETSHRPEHQKTK